MKNTLSKYKNNYLSDENIANIEELPGWQWSPKKSNQNKKLNLLVKVLNDFHKEHGHLWVPVDMEVNGENILISMQYFRGRYHNKNPRRKEIETLESIPGWTWETPVTCNTQEEKWERKFQLLIKYAMINSHTFVPQLYKMEGEKLGSWVERQRLLYKEKSILPHRKERLESLPLWAWKKPSFDDYFLDGLDCLIEYYQKYGLAKPLKSIKTSYGAELNEWIITQRKQYRLGKMPLDRITRLESVKGWAWTSKDQTWYKNFQKLKSFNDRFEHCDVPKTYTAGGMKLKSWVDKVRRKYVSRELKQSQNNLLEKLKGWSEYVEKSRLQQLKFHK